MTPPPEDDDFASIEKFEERADASFDSIFGDGDDEPKEKPDPDPKEKDEPEEVEDDTETQETPEKKEPEEGDEDYDAPVVKKDEKKEVEDIDTETDPKKRDSIAVKQLKELGPKYKAAEARLKELELDAQKAREEAEEARKQADEVRRAKIRPMEDPEYKKLHGEIMSGVHEDAELLPGARKVPENFGEFATDYLAARNAGANREQAIADLKAKIIARCVTTDIPYEDMDEVEKEKVDQTVVGVIKILRGSADKVQSAIDLANKLTADNEEGSITLRQREYERTVGKIKPVLEGLGDLADDLIESNPHSVEALVAKMVKEAPEAKRRSDVAKRDIEEIFAGPRPLSAAEVKKLKAEGTDIKDFENQRLKAHEVKKAKFAAFLYHGLMTRSIVGEMARELAELRGDKDAEVSEKDALRQVLTKKAPAPEKKKEVAVAAGKRRNSALDEMLGDTDDWDDYS